jgi:hypothetical protein
VAVTRAQVAQARQLIAELSALLDVFEADLPDERTAKRRAITPAETPVRASVEAQVRRGLRRRGVVA